MVRIRGGLVGTEGALREQATQSTPAAAPHFWVFWTHGLHLLTMGLHGKSVVRIDVPERALSETVHSSGVDRAVFQEGGPGGLSFSCCRGYICMFGPPEFPLFPSHIPRGYLLLLLLIISPTKVIREGRHTVVLVTCPCGCHQSPFGRPLS